MTSAMRREIEEIPDVVQRQIDDALGDYIDTGRRLARFGVPAILTCARGTSDQAAVYFKYLSEIRAGIPVGSVGPSIASVYRRDLRAKGLAALTISQSGGSPDLAWLQRTLGEGGAKTIALLNVVASPVGDGADIVLPLCAGEEKAVAATKSFVASLVAAAGIVAGLGVDDDFADSIRALPETLWHSVTMKIGLPDIEDAGSGYAVSRGPGFAAAGEAALKMKETCRLPVEAYSAAEILHGPIVIAGTGHFVVGFIPEDEARDSVREAVNRAGEMGSTVIRIGSEADCHIRTRQAPDSGLAAILQIAAFYNFIEAFSVALGRDPDQPPGLAKVTRTI